MRTFQALAAVFALLVMLRHGRAALALLRPRGAPDGEGPGGADRLAGLVPLLACLAAAAVLVAAVRSLLATLLATGASP